MSWTSSDESPYDDIKDNTEVLEPTAETSLLLARLTRDGVNAQAQQQNAAVAPRFPATAKAPTCAVLLLDTEGDMFNSNLIEKGEAGGLEVANELQDRLVRYCQNQRTLSSIESTLVYCVHNSLGRTADICKALNLADAWRSFSHGINTSARMTFCIDEPSKLNGPSAKVTKLLRSYACMPTVGLVLLGGLHAGAYADFITYEIDPVTRHKITLAKTNGAVAPQYAELDLPCTTTFQDLFGGLHYAASTSAGSNVDAGEQYKLIKAKTSASGAPPPDVFFARIKGKNVPIIDTGVESIPGEPEQSASTSKSTAALTAISALAQSPTAIDAEKKGRKQALAASSPAGSKQTEELPLSPVYAKSTNPTMNASAADIRAALQRFTMGSSAPAHASSSRRDRARDKTKSAGANGLASGHDTSTMKEAAAADAKQSHRNAKIKLFPVHSRPCIDFYLAPDGCPRGSKCTFDHMYEFSEAEWAVFPAFVKQLVCKRKATGGKCSHGKDCPYGHSCAHKAASCPFKGACWFLQAGLPHADEI